VDALSLGLFFSFQEERMGFSIDRRSCCDVMASWHRQRSTIYHSDRKSSTLRLYLQHPPPTPNPPGWHCGHSRDNPLAMHKSGRESHALWDSHCCVSERCPMYGILKARDVSEHRSVLIEVTSNGPTQVSRCLTIATPRHIPEDAILHSRRRENLKSYIALIGWTL
jgi:hypothetical protein